MKPESDGTGKEMMVFMISTLMRYREGEMTKKEAFDEARLVNTTIKKHRDQKRFDQGISYLMRN